MTIVYFKPSALATLARLSVPIHQERLQSSTLLIKLRMPPNNPQWRRVPPPSSPAFPRKSAWRRTQPRQCKVPSHSHTNPSAMGTCQRAFSAAERWPFPQALLHPTTSHPRHKLLRSRFRVCTPNQRTQEVSMATVPSCWWGQTASQSHQVLEVTWGYKSTCLMLMETMAGRSSCTYFSSA